MLGPLEVRVDSRLLPLGGPKHRTLLAMLLLLGAVNLWATLARSSRTPPPVAEVPRLGEAQPKVEASKDADRFAQALLKLLDEHPDPTDDQIGHYLSGNLCRCGTYPEIIAAVKLAARKRRAS